MGRAGFFNGLVLLVIAFAAWTFFLGIEEVGYHEYAIHWTFPVLTYLLSAVVWYFLCGINIIKEWNRRPVLLFGKYSGTFGPGFVFIDPVFHTILKDQSIQDRVLEIGGDDQEIKIQTKNNVGIILEGIITYCVNKDRIKDAVVNVEDVDDALYERAISTLTDEGAKSDLDQFLKHRDTFCQDIKNTLIDRVKDWGLTIKAFELKNFKIDNPDIENAIAMNARADKEGQAEITRAGYQEQVVEKLNAAAKKLTEEGKWLKGMETLLEMTRSGNNNTVLIPTELTAALATKFSVKE